MCIFLNFYKVLICNYYALQNSVFVHASKYISGLFKQMLFTQILISSKDYLIKIKTSTSFLNIRTNLLFKKNVGKTFINDIFTKVKLMEQKGILHDIFVEKKPTYTTANP